MIDIKKEKNDLRYTYNWRGWQGLLRHYILKSRKNVLIIERMMPGGQVALTSEIENYPGFSKIDGFTLAEK